MAEYETGVQINDNFAESPTAATSSLCSKCLTVW